MTGSPNGGLENGSLVSRRIARSRLILARGETDWTAPLLEAHARIGPRSLGIVRSDTWNLRFRMFALVSVMIIVIGTTISWVFR